MLFESLNTEELEYSAKLLKTKVINSCEDLNVEAHSNPKISAWTKDKREIVVLASGDILTAAPASPNVSHCEQYLRSHGFKCGKIYPATLSVINELKDRERKYKQGTPEAEETAAIKQLKKLILDASNNGASDIHLEIIPKERKCLIYLRVDGLLKPYANWTDKEGLRVHSVAYNSISEDRKDTFNQRKPQDASFTVVIEQENEKENEKGSEKANEKKSKEVRIRSSNIPTHNSCKITYRLLSIGETNVLPIKSLGYSVQQEQLLYESRDYKSGLVLFCGETGSGKTTSLASVLSGIDARKQVYSIEDPVEKIIKHAKQISIDHRDEKRSFAYYLRALLRADPDVIMVGEIRDQETAKVAVQSALTGHLLLSTLHTRYAVDAILRLTELGVSPKYLATPNLIKLIVAQELHPILCAECRRLLNKKEKKKIGYLYSIDELEQLYTANKDSSCTNCQGKGITRRKVFAEIIRMDKTSRLFIAEMKIHEWQNYLISQGFIFLTDRIRNAVLNGEVDALDLKSMEPPEEECYQYKNESLFQPLSHSLPQADAYELAIPSNF